MERIENRTFDEIKPGDTASLVRTLTHKDIELFAVMSGDINPTHLDDAFAKSDMFHKVVAHGGALISTVLGTQLPGPGTVYVDQSLHFLGAIGLGDTISISVKVRKKIEEMHRVIFDCRAVKSKSGGGHHRHCGCHRADREDFSTPCGSAGSRAAAEGTTLRDLAQDDLRSRPDPYSGCPPGRHAIAAGCRRPHQSHYAGSGWAEGQDSRRRRQITGGILDGRSPSTMRSRWSQPRRKGSLRRLPAVPTSSWCQTSSPATCWRNNSSTSRKRRWPASCSERGCRSF